jgi:hypothetical protein
MIELEARRHTLFLKCRDRAGNENQEYFVKFDVKEDNLPPEILNQRITVQADLAKLKFKINENAECSYSIDSDQEFENMEGKIPCRLTSSGTSVFDTNYDCETQIPYQPGMRFFIRCKDKPAIFRNYAMHFIQSELNELTTANHPSLIKITDSFINITNDYAIANNYTKISTFYPTVEVGINFDTNKICRYGTNQKDSYDKYLSAQQMSCSGKYCEKDIQLNGNTSIYFGCIDKINELRNVNPTSIVLQP